MVQFDYFDESSNKDYVWYQSANLVYSEASYNSDDTVNLKIVFQKGATYIYYKVDALDYYQVKRAESTGNAFNIFINKKVNDKPKYEYRRIADSSLETISSALQSFKDKAMKEEEEKTKENTLEELVEKTETKEQVKVVEDKHKVDMKFDEASGRMLFFVDGEKVSEYPCVNKNGYARLALFLAPIMSYLGCPLKIEVGD